MQLNFFDAEKYKRQEALRNKYINSLDEYCKACGEVFTPTENDNLIICNDCRIESGIKINQIEELKGVLK